MLHIGYITKFMCPSQVKVDVIEDAKHFVATYIKRLQDKIKKNHLGVRFSYSMRVYFGK